MRLTIWERAKVAAGAVVILAGGLALLAAIMWPIVDHAALAWGA